jgi:hypothetical protein
MAEGSQHRVVRRTSDRGPSLSLVHSEFRTGMKIADVLLSSQLANTKKAGMSTPYSFVWLVLFQDQRLAC